MKIKKQQEIKNTHMIVDYNGYEIHRREKMEYDQKKKEWVRKSLNWTIEHGDLDRMRRNDANKPSSKQLEREYQLNLIGL